MIVTAFTVVDDPVALAEWRPIGANAPVVSSTGFGPSDLFGLSYLFVTEPSHAVFVGLGEINEAVRWVQRALADRSPDMVCASVASRLTPRRAANTGFRAILDQMAFPPSAR